MRCQLNFDSSLIVIQNDATVGEILTVNNAELDHIIYNSGIFLSAEEWNKKRESVMATLTTASINDDYEKTRSTRAEDHVPAAVCMFNIQHLLIFEIF